MGPYWGYLRVAIGIAIIVVLVWYHYDAVVLANQFDSLQPLWIFLAGLSIALATVCGGINAYILVSHDSQLSQLRFLAMYWMAWAASLVIPGQIGDVASLSAMLRSHGFEWHTSIGRVLLDKIISLSAIILFALLGLFSLVNANVLIIGDMDVIFVGAMVAVLALYVSRSYLRSIFDPKNSGWRGFVGRAISEVSSTVSQYPKRVLLNCFLTCIKIGLIGFSYWCIFSAFGQNLDVWQVILLSAASSLVAYIPISFNGIGTVEIAGIFLFVGLGVAEATTLSVYLVLRLLVFALAWGPAVFWFIFGWKKATHSS